MACCPLMPSAITSMSGTVLIKATKPCRTTAWSSITMILILLFTVAPLLTTDRSASPDPGATVRPLNRQRPANLLGALAHSDQTEVAVVSISQRLIVKAATVVSNNQLHALGVEHQLHAYRMGLRMFHGILDCLL